MTKLHSLTIRFFDQVVIARPGLVIFCLLLVVAGLTYHAKDFRLDASAETLVLENDKDLAFSRTVANRYGIQEFLVVTYTPKGELLSDASLKTIADLQDELARLDAVSSVFSILNAPLLESPPVPVGELVKNIRTLDSPGVDRRMAHDEFQNSPLYRDLIVSPDLKSTALLLYLTTDPVYQELHTRRNALRDKQAAGRLSIEETAAYNALMARFKQQHDIMREKRHQDILAIRGVMDNYREDAELFLGGVSMVADDLISFIKSDLKVFGFGILFFLILTLGIIFKKLRWILLPMLCCGLSGISMIGILGLFGWEVTVISSNFISLQLIITMAITIHLVVRYRELHYKNPEASQGTLTRETIRLKLVPCLYAALTTIAGFSSLLFCDILPVITFGWMMTAGIVLSLILTFLLFPAVLVLMKKGAPTPPKTSRASLVPLLATFTERHGNLILVLSMVVLVISGIGVAKLQVENSFIDYFKKSTEIYQGMKVIDQRLGGTTPLDVIIDLKPAAEDPARTTGDAPGNDDSAGDVFDDFEDFEEFEETGNNDRYWFTTGKIDKAVAVHDYLESLPATGKVLSLGTMAKIAKNLNGGKPLDNFQLALIYKEIPQKYKDLMIAPYVSVENDQLRFSVRVKDSEKSLRRNEFLKKVRSDLINHHDLKEENVHLAGMLVLYNNMLQSLFSSQILTLGIVLVALTVMFMVLFRSVKIAIVAIFPNLLSIGMVLGLMGWLGIPLDMMTITIAAISVGIAVDDTIHYIHRFKEEFHTEGNYVRALHRSHESIGYAMYYTSITIIAGFSILILSQFIPSIYFGILTGLAMLIALIAALTLLPQLLVFLKPFGPELNGE